MQVITHIINTMSPPVLHYISREQREKDGYKSFKECIEQYNQQYTGPIILNYVKNIIGYPSLWIKPFHKYFKQDQANAFFESFIRLNTILMDSLPKLEN